MTLLRDLIPIPERVHQSDFVLRLTQGLEDAERTLQDYVVTDQLVGCFDEALGIIQKAVATGVSKAAYLHRRFRGREKPLYGRADPVTAGNTEAARSLNWPRWSRERRVDRGAASSWWCAFT